MNDKIKEKIEIREKLKIHPNIPVHHYNLWIPMDIWLKLYKIQEENMSKIPEGIDINIRAHMDGCGLHTINYQIVEILKKHFKD